MSKALRLIRGALWVASLWLLASAGWAQVFIGYGKADSTFTGGAITSPLLFPSGTSAAPGGAFSANSAYGFFLNGTNTFAFSAMPGGVAYCRDPGCTSYTLSFGGDVFAASDRSIGWSSTTQATGTKDVYMKRDAAGTVVISDGTDEGKLRFGATLFTNLGTPTDGTVLYCSDCTKATPCAGSGNGAIAKRLNGAWDCD